VVGAAGRTTELPGRAAGSRVQRQRCPPDEEPARGTTGWRADGNVRVAPPELALHVGASPGTAAQACSLNVEPAAGDAAGDAAGIERGSATSHLSSNCHWRGGLDGPEPAREADFLVRGAAAIAPSCVNITVDPPGDHRWRKSSVSVAADSSSGSGCLVKSDGVILTNAHVVNRAYPPSDSGPALWVTLSDGRRMEGRVLQLDATNDLAVVKLKQGHRHLPPAAQLATPARLASLQVGEWVVAGGSPLSLKNTVTHGIVSAIGRDRREIGGDPSVNPRRWGYIQTDAAINNGNSGGPLAVCDRLHGGIVVGVNTMRASGASGISFATPVSSKDVDELLELGKLARPFLGINMLQLNQALIVEMFPTWIHGEELDGNGSGSGSSSFHESNEPELSGVFVRDVVQHSPADRAGLRARDIIIEVNGTKVQKATDVLQQVGTAIGAKVRFKYIRIQGADNRVHVATAVATTEAAPKT
jgi:S1-C subfamily serine protease